MIRRKAFRGTLADRLHHYSARVGDCIEWTGLRDRKGYGRIGVDGAMRAAHRVAYAELVGPIPEGLVVRHACDNPPCINPDHLQVGSKADNTRDAIERGRFPMGERNGYTRLTNDHAVAIYRRASAGESCMDIAREYGVGKSTAYRIFHGESWSSVTGAVRHVV